jgi:hypothetical protein
MMPLPPIEPKTADSLTNKARPFKLPSIDNILELCRSRKDFPQHLNDQEGPRKRRRSLVQEFLHSDFSEGEPVHKRPRALSLDSKNSYKVFSWHNVSMDKPNQSSGVKSIRRHSMMDAKELQLFQARNESGQKKGAIRPWTIEEDGILLSAVKAYGDQWCKVAAVLSDSSLN